MTREDIRNTFEGATDAQINRLLDIHSADIGRVRAEGARHKSDLDAANATIEQLRTEAGKAADLQKKIDEIEMRDAERAEAEKAAKAREALEKRFNTVSGDKQYIHDMVRAGVLEDFGKAIADEANTGKSDADIFDALTKDKGFFKSSNPPGNMGGIGGVSGDDNDALSDAEYYERIFQKK